MIRVSIHMDGTTSGCDYKYIITKGAMSWTAYKTDKGFKNFMQVYGLKINPEHTEYRDYRQYGKGRMIISAMYDKQINDHYFYNLEDVPQTAIKTIALCNGSYVDCYAADHGDSIDFYRPNPNAKSVYIPYDYFQISKQQG